MCLAAFLEERRWIVRHFLDIATYEPATQAEWDDTYSRFLTMREQVGQSEALPQTRYQLSPLPHLALLA